MDSVTSVHYELDWLLVRVRIENKILLLVFKCLNKMALKYLENLLCVNNRDGIAGNLHSSNSAVLIVPYVMNKIFASHSFSVKDLSGGID